MPIPHRPEVRHRLCWTLWLSVLLHLGLMLSLRQFIMPSPALAPAAVLQVELFAQNTTKPFSPPLTTAARQDSKPSPSTAQQRPSPPAHAAAINRPAVTSSSRPADTASTTRSTLPASEPPQAAATPAGMASSAAPPNAQSSASGSTPDDHPAWSRTDYLQNPEPPYPERSLELREQGRVLLQVRVSAEGRAIQVEIIQSSQHRRLDEAAQQAVSHWRFVAARKNGSAVESSILVPITFQPIQR